MNVAVFVGAPPFGGKGTTCELVQRYFAERGAICTHFSVRDTLRERAQRDLELSRILQAREPVTKEYGLRFLDENVPKKGVVLFDDFPRNYFQALVALQYFKDKADWMTVSAHIRVPTEVVMERLSHKIQDSPEETDSINESVSKSLDVYLSETVNVFGILEKQADHACDINVTKGCSKEEVALRVYRFVNDVMVKTATNAVLGSHTSPAVLSRR